MKSVPKLIRRFVSIMFLSSVLLIILNFILLVVYTLNQKPNVYPWATAEEVAGSLSYNNNGYVLSGDTGEKIACGVIRFVRS